MPEQSHTEKGTQPLSFFENRMKLLGVTPENNIFEYYNPEAEPPASKVQPGPIFQEAAAGDIVINYYTIEGHRIVYYTDAKTPGVGQRVYQTRRLAQPQGDMKYNMPAGQGTFPWFHPDLVAAVRDKRAINTLYITEGVFKGWMGTQCGLPTVALSSITHYADKEKNLHRGIVQLINACQVENVVILWDGDCLNVSAGDIQRREEATRRPKGFFNAAKALRKLILTASYPELEKPPRVFFMHPNSEYWDERPKGLDDVLILAQKKGAQEEVVRNLAQLHDNRSGQVYALEITHSTDLLYKHFLLYDVDRFYTQHHRVIGEKEFYFDGDMYHFSENENKVVMLQPSWARNVYWVGDEFFEELRKPSANPNFDKLSLEHRKKETLAARYKKGFIRHLKYFYGFVNVPDHFNYERIIERDGKAFLNQYNPFPHVPQAGAWDNIAGFLKHIFGEHIITHPKTGEQIAGYELGLDYLQIMLTEPLQQLPILVLYSAENQTGKSTFGELCYKLFGDNVVFIGNADLQSDFNEVYANRLLAICEETLLERRRDAERIKNMSTASRITVNPKGQRQYSIDFFTKFQFYSNNKRMVYVTRHDDRYWIIEVPAVDKDKRDPELKSRMWAELPAFVAFLKERTLATRREARMHFNPDLLVTKTLQETVRVNEPAEAADLRLAIKEWFIDLGADVTEIRMPLQNIRDKFFPKSASQRWIQELLKDYLKVDLLRHPTTGETIHARGEYREMRPSINSQGEADMVWEVTRWRGRPYIFRREDFVDETVLAAEEMEVQEKPISQATKVAANGMTAPEELPF